MQKYLPLFLCLLLYFSSCTDIRAQQVDSLLYEQTSEVNNLMIQYNADESSLKRVYFIMNSPERRERLKIMNEGYLDQLSKMDFDRLPVGSRVDYILFWRNIREVLRLLAKEEEHANDMHDLLVAHEGTPFLPGNN